MKDFMNHSNEGEKKKGKKNEKKLEKRRKDVLENERML